MSTGEAKKSAIRVTWPLFISLTTQYLKNAKEVRAALKKRDLVARLVVEATDASPAALLTIKNHDIFVDSLSAEDAKDKTKWDGKISGSAQMLFYYFTGDLGLIRPLLFGKLKATRLLNLLKMTFFVKLSQKVFKHNISFARAIWGKFKND